jgi:Protein of unknown function (DUF2948)
MPTKLLKLKAKDAEDVQIVSAVLQDSIVPVCDIAWQPEQKTFIMVVQRLLLNPEDQADLERICCAVNLRGVESAQVQGIDLNDRARMLDLLMMMVEGDNLQFLFAGDAKIRLKLANWSMIIEDFGESWPAHCKPCHDGESAA